MTKVPSWLLPWLFPLMLIVGLAAVAISAVLGLVVLGVLLLGVVPYLRLQYLKQHPPNPELRRRNFWDLR